MRNPLLLGIGILVIFVVTVAAMLRLMPEPRKDIDYLVIGGMATMVAMAVLFIVLLKTRFKGSDIFFKRRK